ncbi:MAG: DUF3488 domain-containing protein [Myxococcales bacterium]|nr:DUF3488 domain-containing protein [Myxococcales bacterium]
MVVSGSVPLWAVAIFAMSLALALFGKRILEGRGKLAGVGLGLLALAAFGVVLLGRLDLVVAACAFASAVTSYRMLSAMGPAADRQVLLTGVLMLSGGAALSGDLLFAPFLAAFALLAIPALAVGTLDSPMDLPVGPVLRHAAAGAALALLAGAAVFIAFPRLSWSLGARRTSPGLGGATAGFSERVRLGGQGSIKTSPRVVARVHISPEPEADRLDAYWFGRAFDTFTGREWRGAGRQLAPAPSIKLGPSGTEMLRQEIELLPAYSARTLIGLDPVVSFGQAAAHTQGGTGRTQLVEVEGEEVRFAEDALAYTYYAYSLAFPLPRKERISRDRFLSLPEPLDPRVGALARRIAGGERDPLAAARKLAEHLRSEYRYTLELPGEVEDPLADFLFERKEGHCEHFATALAVMLRTLGYPSRVAGGFFGGERVRGSFVLRAGDAHAWTQVFVEGRGFVTVDATPDANRAGQPAPLLEWLSLRYEELESHWRGWVLDYTLRDQIDLAYALVRPPREPSVGATLPPLRAWLAAALAGACAYSVWRALTRRAGRPRRHRASTLLDGIERILAAEGIERRAGETTEELSVRLASGRHPWAPEVSRATRRYLEARFGRRPLGPGEREALLEGLRRSAPGRRRV